MGMQINTNLAANNAYRSLNNTQTDLSKSLEKLSSGLRINRAADDAAGLALSEGLKSQVGGLTVAARNAQDGIGVIQTAEGGLSQAHSILQRLRDLGVQAANDTNNDESRAAITAEATSLHRRTRRGSRASTDFNGTKLLDGSSPSAEHSRSARTASRAARSRSTWPGRTSKEYGLWRLRNGSSRPVGTTMNQQTEVACWCDRFATIRRSRSRMTGPT